MSILKKNAKFQKLTKGQKRVAVAQDVIASLKSGQIKAIQGTWAEPLRRENFVPEDKEVEFCEVLNKTKCKCCGLGALFVEAVKRFDKFKSVVAVDDYDIYHYLKKIFSEEQLDMIECSFECGDGVNKEGSFKDAIPSISSYGEYCYEYNSKTYDRCVRFGKTFKTPRLRMTAIMQNIVNNNGTFKP